MAFRGLSEKKRTSTKTRSNTHSHIEFKQVYTQMGFKLFDADLFCVFNSNLFYTNRKKIVCTGLFIVQICPVHTLDGAVNIKCACCLCTFECRILAHTRNGLVGFEIMFFSSNKRNHSNGI